MGMETGSGMSVADVMALQNRNTDGSMFGGAGGTWVWVFFLFFLLAWGGGGFGFGNGAAAQGALTRADLCQDFNFNDLQNGVRSLSNGLCDGFYAMNTTMLQGFNGLGNQVQENRFASQQCCCETNRNIDAVRYENARNTCDIVNAIKADGDATRALMTQNTIQELRDNLQAAQLQLGNLSQTQTIINAVRPFPTPSYITCSPYTAANGYGSYGCCNGCGC